MGCHSTCHSALTDFTVDTLNDKIITVGEDGFVRLWDKDARVILQQHNLERGLSCIAYNQGADQVAVGFCKSDNCCSSDKTDVAFVILCGNDLTNIIHHGHNSQKTLTVCKFSNDGKFVAFGAKDCGIYIHSTDKDFPLVAKARGHFAPILTFDFGCADDSPDSASFLRSNSINGEALYWSTHARSRPLSASVTHVGNHKVVYLVGTWKELMTCALKRTVLASLHAVHYLIGQLSLEILEVDCEFFPIQRGQKIQSTCCFQPIMAKFKRLNVVEIRYTLWAAMTHVSACGRFLV